MAEDIYVLLLNRVQELSVQKAGTGGNVHIVDAALRPGAPVKPKKVLILSAAVILGLICGTGFVFLRRNMFKGIDDPDHVERAFHLPLFGLVPLSAEQAVLERKQLHERGGERSAPGLATMRGRRMSAIEILRSLRTSHAVHADGSANQPRRHADRPGVRRRQELSDGQPGRAARELGQDAC